MEIDKPATHKKMLLKVLTVGGAMIDTIAIIESSRIELMKMRNADTSFLLLEEGRKTEAFEISTHCGGGAINTAVAMARLGCEVATIVKLGRDGRADTVLRRLGEEGVSTRWVVRDESAPTGASVIVSSHDRNAAIFTFRGANGLLEAKDLGAADAGGGAFAVDLLHISSLSDASADRFPVLVSRAKDRGAMVSANPGVRQLSARGSAFREALARIDILTLNRGEGDVLVPSLGGDRGFVEPDWSLADGGEMPALARRGLTSGGHALGLGSFLGILTGLGPRYVLLTDGASGAFVATKDEILFCPALATKVMGTAGAGDAFAATFATLIGLGRPPATALRAATINAAAVLAFVDTQSGLLRRDVLDARLAASSDTLQVRNWPL